MLPIKQSLFALALWSAISAAHAEDINQNVSLIADSDTPGSFSAGWGVTHTRAGLFTDTLSVANGSAGSFSASLVTIGFFASQDINFISATVNGQTFTLSPTGALETGQVGPFNITTPIVLHVTGVVAPTLAANTPIAASYAATSNISAVPELQTYALMLAGLGMILSFARRRMAH